MTGRDNLARRAVVTEYTQSHLARVGGTTVRRALPRAGRRSIGAWCFADHLGPLAADRQRGLGVGPHPHMGLATATWLFQGTSLHRDNLHSVQRLQPGELNLMHSGNGVAHAEEGTGDYEGPIEGLQLWTALPESTRHGAASFAHHADLPTERSDDLYLTLVLGEFEGMTSPGRCDSPLLCVEISGSGFVEFPLDREFEYGIIVLEGAAMVESDRIVPGHLAYLGEANGRLALSLEPASRVMLLGGEPFHERILMWWNFVGRTSDEFEDAYRSWINEDGRFGVVDSSLDRILGDPPTGFPTPRGH